MRLMHYVLLLAIVIAAICLSSVVTNSETPEIENPNLIITGNVIVDNGFGIYVGWHGEWISEISGNLIADNGEGIRIVNKAATIFDNVIRDNITGVRVTSAHQGEEVTEVISVSLFRNVIAGNFTYGLQNLADLTIDARDNWWGSPDGPLVVDETRMRRVGEDQIEEALLREWRTIVLVFELPLLSGVKIFDFGMTFTRDLSLYPSLSLSGVEHRSIIGIHTRNRLIPRFSTPLILRVPVEVAEEEPGYVVAETSAPFERIFGPVQYSDWRAEEFSPITQPAGQPRPSRNNESPAAKIEPEDAVHSEDTEKPGNANGAGEGTIADLPDEPLRDTVDDDRIVAFPERALAFAQHTTVMGIIPFETFTGADFTGEGSPDLALAARHSRQIFLLVGDGSGSFDFTANFDSGILAKRLWSADINNDGHFDLILTDDIYEGIVFLLGSGTGTFSLPLFLPVGLLVSEALFTRPDSATPFDFILLSYQGNRLLTYSVADDTSFSLGEQIALNRPRSPVLGDFNGDGHSDIAVITGEEEIAVVWGRQIEWMDAPAVIHTEQQRILSIESGDFNNDGLCDIIFSSAESNTIGLLIGTPQGDFVQAAGTDIAEDPVRLVAIDFDKDGNTDLAAILLQSNQVAVLRGRGDGSFQDGNYFFIRNLSSELHIGDLDNDSRPDILILKTDGNRLTTLSQEDE